MKKWPFFGDRDREKETETENEEALRDAELNALAGDGGERPSKGINGIYRNRPVWAIWAITLSLAVFLWIAVMGFVGSSRLEKRAQLQTESAAVWMKGWDPRVSQAPVEGTVDCPSGPSPICVKVSVGRVDLGGNPRVEPVVLARAKLGEGLAAARAVARGARGDAFCPRKRVWKNADSARIA